MNPDGSRDDPTSDYEPSVDASEFTSVSTARLRHLYENGRRYQGYSRDRYGLPNDEAEQSREHMKHNLYTDYILKGHPILAPIGDHPQKIVDLGTGVGHWPQDVAERFPGARIIGTDLSPIQPLWAPPNVEFRVEDLEDEARPWTNIYTDADLIHIRTVLQTVRDPRRLIRRSFENLKPGGWIQCHEIIPRAFSDDGTAGDDHPLNTLYTMIEERFSSTYGWNIRFPNEITKVFRETGFVNIEERHNHIPIGRWHTEAKMREMGLFNQSLCDDWVIAMLTKHDAMGMTAEEANSFLHKLLNDFDNPRIHAQLDYIDCWAQKPLDS